MNTTKISVVSRIVLLVVSGLLLATLFFPMWRIELSAPQYPEGLVLQLHANKIAGNVDIINGLNHYIGMKTLHTEDFIEFKILPYILGGFAVFALAVMLIGNRKLLYVLFGTFILFIALAAADFYRWNYQYGHNLDPKAAIQVPGMSYQPPMLGYKQLLNFGAYSIPDKGGWMMIAAAVLLFIIVLIEAGLFKKKVKANKLAAAAVISFMFISCANPVATPIKLNSDSCAFCGMTVADGKFGAEITTQKGRVYIFDDIQCMLNYCREKAAVKISAYYVHDYKKNNVLISAPAAFFLKGKEIQSPMRGGIIAFTSEKQAREYIDKFHADLIGWNDLLNNK